MLYTLYIFLHMYIYIYSSGIYIVNLFIYENYLFFLIFVLHIFSTCVLFFNILYYYYYHNLLLIAINQAERTRYAALHSNVDDHGTYSVLFMYTVYIYIFHYYNI